MRSNERPDVFFSVQTPLGFSVRTTRDYWALIQRKHPEVADKAEEIQSCLGRPARVRRSAQDPAVYLFYTPLPPYHLAVMIRRLNGDGFVITSCLTSSIKEGVEIWPTSG